MDTLCKAHFRSFLGNLITVGRIVILLNCSFNVPLKLFAVQGVLSLNHDFLEDDRSKFSFDEITERLKRDEEGSYPAHLRAKHLSLPPSRDLLDPP